MRADEGWDGIGLLVVVFILLRSEILAGPGPWTSMSEGVLCERERGWRVWWREAEGIRRRDFRSGVRPWKSRNVHAFDVLATCVQKRG
jgi:hypothetical protein